MERLLIVGCGDVARRLIPLLVRHYRVYALIRDDAQAAGLRALGVTPVAGDLDVRERLARIAGLADRVLHLAPPPDAGIVDPRTRHLLAALSQRRPPRQLVYLSTSGVYGDCGGALVPETRPIHPQTARAQRRVDAERQIRAWAAGNGVRACVLRVPGIYARERLPLERIRAGQPAIAAEQDGYTSHIHADDLARVIAAALRHGRPNRVYHASDDGAMKLGDYFDAVADAHGLPRPPRITRAEAQRVLPESLLSFMGESRRLVNGRMKKELGVVLRYPRVTDLLASFAAGTGHPVAPRS